MCKLSQTLLKELLHYNHETGEVYWKIKIHSSVTVGQVLSNKDDRSNYIGIGIFGRKYKLHRIIYKLVTGDNPRGFIDHIDHNRSNNSWNNLRVVTQAVNNQNRTENKNNSSGFTGVGWVKAHGGKWRARISVESKEVLLGYFDNKEDAIFARTEANTKYGYHENHGLVKE